MMDDDAKAVLAAEPRIPGKSTREADKLETCTCAEPHMNRSWTAPEHAPDSVRRHLSRTVPDTHRA